VKIFLLILLWTVAVASLGLGIKLMGMASTVFHEIEALLMFLITAVTLSAIYVGECAPKGK
jgi:hypothetical protein